MREITRSTEDHDAAWLWNWPRGQSFAQRVWFGLIRRAIHSIRRLRRLPQILRGIFSIARVCFAGYSPTLRRGGMRLTNNCSPNTAVVIGKRTEMWWAGVTRLSGG